MIQLHLIPDGGRKVPVEAEDHATLASFAEGSIDPADSEPADSWRDIERVVRGSGDRITLRMPGSLADYKQETLDQAAAAFTGQVSGLKKHVEGWHDAPEPRKPDGG